MDVNVALDNARKAIGEADPTTLADALNAIDGWLSRRGFLPADWQARNRPNNRREVADRLLNSVRINYRAALSGDDAGERISAELAKRLTVTFLELDEHLSAGLTLPAMWRR